MNIAVKTSNLTRDRKIKCILDCKLSKIHRTAGYIEMIGAVGYVVDYIHKGGEQNYKYQ
jgi:hypothetical protein